MRKKVKVFISYAHANKELVSRFVTKIEEYTRPSLNYEYQIWWDKKLLIGEEWQKEIIQTLEECDLGLLMISASCSAVVRSTSRRMRVRSSWSASFLRIGSIFM